MNPKHLTILSSVIEERIKAKIEESFFESEDEGKNRESAAFWVGYEMGHETGRKRR